MASLPCLGPGQQASLPQPPAPVPHPATPYPNEFCVGRKYGGGSADGQGYICVAAVDQQYCSSADQLADLYCACCHCYEPCGMANTVNAQCRETMCTGSLTHGGAQPPISPDPYPTPMPEAPRAAAAPLRAAAPWRAAAPVPALPAVPSPYPSPYCTGKQLGSGADPNKDGNGFVCQKVRAARAARGHARHSPRASVRAREPDGRAPAARCLPCRTRRQWGRRAAAALSSWPACTARAATATLSAAWSTSTLARDARPCAPEPSLRRCLLPATGHSSGAIGAAPLPRARGTRRDAMRADANGPCPWSWSGRLICSRRNGAERTAAP